MIPALTLLNAYIALAAASLPAYRTDLQSGREAGPGRAVAQSPLLGSFTYRPKSYGELDLAQRLALLRSPGWRSYLARRAAEPAPAPGAGAAAVIRFSIPPEEMLQGRPFILSAPTP